MGTHGRNLRFGLMGLVVAGCGTAATMSPSVVPTSSGSHPPPTSCTGLDEEWAHIPEPARSYGLAWNERDGTARMDLLEAAFAADGTYVSPLHSEPLRGRTALHREIGRFLATSPGEYFEFRSWSAADRHHDALRIHWRLCDAAGQTVLEGQDFGVLDAEGRLGDVIGFDDET
jgi:hypothetical protein